jgi:hypothetical protein
LLFQVQKHLARLQAEKERAALDQIKGAFADMPEAVLVVALQEASWDLSQATHLLNAFQTERAGELAQIRKAGTYLATTNHVVFD